MGPRKKLDFQSAAEMRRRYGPRALSVSIAMKNIARTAAQRDHWNRVVRALEGKRNPESVNIDIDVGSHNAKGRTVANKFKTNSKKRAKKNPAKRIRSVPGKTRLPSVATRKKATKRLIRRRTKTIPAPKGYYANPVKRGYTILANGAELATFKTRTHAKDYGTALARRHPGVKVQLRLP